jgi:hypothetical protein
MRDLSEVSLKPSDFQALAQVCRSDHDFPADFAGWSLLMRQAANDAQAR